MFVSFSVFSVLPYVFMRLLLEYISFLLIQKKKKKKKGIEFWTFSET